MIFFSTVADLDSYKKVINRLITFLIVLSLCISFIAIWLSYYSFEKKSKSLSTELLINSNSILQSNISEKLSIIVNNQDFVSYLNKGEYSRRLNIVNMMVLFKNFIDKHFIVGISVKNKTNDSILNLADTKSPFYVNLDLCYLNGQINNQFGNCYDEITLFMSKAAYLAHLSKVNSSIQICGKNKSKCVEFKPFALGKFGSFSVHGATEAFISIKYASPSTYQFFIPAILIFIISTLGLLMIHRLVKFLTNKYLAKPIQEIETSLKNNRPLTQGYIKEINYLAKEIEEYHEHKFEIELGKNLAQVAHDMRSPLLAVDSFFCLVEKKLTESERVFGRRAIRRLDDLVWSLLYKYKNKDEEHHSTDDNYVFLHSCVQELLSEKRMEYAKQNIEFEFTVNSNDVFSLAHLSPLNLKRMLSNLINNAVNALLPKSGTVEVSLETNIAGSLIAIKDNGRGMPATFVQDILINARSKNTKTNLGLPHAIKFLDQIGGKFDIASNLDHGTTVLISLPPCDTPYWCFKEYQIHGNELFVIIDDSKSVHDVWDEMFRKFHDIEYQHFYTPQESLAFFENQTDKKLIIFCDYEFFDDNQNGFDILDQAPVDALNVLVTSYLYNPTIMEKAINKGFKILPKDLVPYFKLHQKDYQGETRLIFIDDEPRNTQSWEFFAEAKNLKIATYNKIKEFLAHANHFQKDIPVYLDLDLSEEKNGIAYAKDIHELGFEKIYISTGAIDVRLKKSDYPWITDIVEKRCPFV